jgi:hypothetical protein
MKKNILLVIILLSIAVSSACKKDKGPDIRESFVATYSVAETWTENGKAMTKPDFTMSVEKSSQYVNMILLNNFGNYGAGVTVDATVSGSTITIAQQTLPNLKEINGSGTLTENTLNFTYTESYKGVSFQITSIAKKK